MNTAASRNIAAIFSALWLLLPGAMGCSTPATNCLPHPAMPHLTASMFNADFWIAKQHSPNDILMQPSEIEQFNAKVRDARLGVIDPATHPLDVDGSQIKEMIAGNVTGRLELGKAFLNGEPVTEPYLKSLNDSLNLSSIPDQKRVSYGLAIRRTMLRTFPTDDRVHYTPTDREFDRLVESAISIGKPVIILHESSDKLWRYVQTIEFDGWVKATDIAIATSREEWLAYLSAPRKLVILGSRVLLGINPYTPEVSGQILTMGSAFPLIEGDSRPRFVDRMETSGQYVISLPQRQQDGSLSFQTALVPFSADVQIGFLPFTRANLIRQAFKMQGERYGWGGDFGSRDCSLFVGDVYRSMGLTLPRNSRLELASPGVETRFTNGDSEAQRSEALKKSAAGAMIGFPGHIMLYLGEHNGEHYAIHAGSAFGDKSKKNIDGTYEELPLNQVSVTALSTLRVTGKTYRDTLTIIKLIR